MDNPTKPQRISEIIDKHRPDLSEFEAIYKDVHQHPELGTKESRTGKIAAKYLTGLGFEVYDHIGGHGLAGVLRSDNSSPIVLLRADMDALGLQEQTDLPYKSTIPNVMHACGHDMHVAALLAAAKLLHAAKSEWSGTLICIFQPNEEGGAGARAMVDDGLYDKIPIPDIVLGQHVSHMKTGSLFLGSGVVLSAADSVTVTVYGRSGHGSQPENCIDPILIASSIVVRLQSIVSRVIAPGDFAVVTCGSIHGGISENAIPDEVELKLNIRTQNERVRAKVLDAMRRIINSECLAGGTTQPPDIVPTSRFPLTENNSQLVDGLHSTFTHLFGELADDPGMVAGSEDFSDLATPNGTPYAYWFFGGTDAEKWNEAVTNDAVHLLPHNHSAKFAPVIQPTLKTGSEALALAALTFLKVD